MYSIDVRSRAILLRTSRKAPEVGNGNESIQSGGRQRSGELVPRARRRATAGIGQEWASSGFGGALPVLCEENPAHYHYQEPGRCGTGRFLHIEHFEERSSFSTWHTRIAINSALMISRRRRNFSEIPAKDSGAVGWSQEIADSAPNPENIAWRKSGSGLCKGQSEVCDPTSAGFWRCNTRKIIR